MTDHTAAEQPEGLDQDYESRLILSAPADVVFDALGRLMEGKTSIVIAHRLSTIQRADKIFVIEDGAIAETGKHHELMAKGGLYAKLHDIQFRERERTPESQTTSADS